MKRASVIPNRKIIRIPLESYLQVVVRRNMSKQVLQNGITLVFRDFHNPLCESTIRHVHIQEYYVLFTYRPFHPVTGLVRIIG